MSTIHITANSRLTQTLKQRAFNEASQAVIVTPQVMTLAQWWAQWEQAALLTGEIDPLQLNDKVLSAFEAQMLWEQVLEAESADRERRGESALDLLNPASTAKQLHQAWTLWMEWLNESQREETGGLHFQSGESRLFHKAAERYRQRLQENGWQDEVGHQQVRLAWLEAGVGRLPERFELHGFDELTPLMQRWRSAVEGRGCPVEVHTVPEETLLPKARICQAQDPQDEVRKVADWCRQQWLRLQNEKPAHTIKIAVVSPGLEEVKTALVTALDEQLVQHRQQTLHLENSQLQPLYNVSLGVRLSEVPLVKNGLQTLTLFLQPQRQCAYDDWSEWLLSPYSGGALEARHKGDVALRRLQWASFKWPGLLESEAAQQTLPTSLLKRLQRWQKRIEKAAGSLSLGAFVSLAETCLETLDWTGGRTLNSDEFQQKTAFIEALGALKTLTTVRSNASAGYWLGVLQRFVSERVHQPQSRGIQPIQVMGVLEAGGQQFDALWVMGLTDQAWPRLPDPNPFLPIGLQRRYKLPRCDAARELEYALQLTRRLRGAAPQQVWSYARYQDEAERLPSPLLESMDFEGGGVYEAPSADTLAEAHHALRGELEWVLDNRGPEIPPGSKAPGGTGILQAQSQCPLMAFIDYRLGARQDLKAVEEGLQSTHQGTLVHEILEAFWQEVQTQSGLFALGDEGIEARLVELIDARFEALKSSFDAPYLAVERSRILGLLLEWMEVEKTRPPFAVSATESEKWITLAGIEFKVVIDRIDEIDGRAVILDYKTGKASINALFKSPLQAPQLAVYLHQQEEVAGIGYALLHSDDGAGLSAVTEEEEVLSKRPSVKVFSKMAEKEGGEFYQVAWPDFLDSLREEVETLARSIQQGVADLRFEQPADVAYAAGWLALRLPEAERQLAEAGIWKEAME